ncbi:YaiI/YqxD family protein [Aneurinibacillus sp. Ricciae_BoGa-3]|uniref:YaiI/YqxD family protein n=1 Tax=Aneurinibacillus sp. Ricciae_BoGa-3 TaxID=3022697 RepID=UPI00234266AA|nr:YaiI/YqxD family protein [Aneurinibacillus sp. Ricciae_BoGa-3]WCK53456.1 YaiI/YqxD family protein [Aneurinibacillus sp. Ricciae_BoGa-3]
MIDKIIEIWVDADSCPVKQDILAVAEAHNTVVHFVASYAHSLSIHHPQARTYAVDSEFQSADMFIINHVKPDNLVITDDYGLASLALEKRCLAIGTRGKEYTNENISLLLMSRHVSAEIARAGGRRRGPGPLRKEEIARFRQVLQKLLHRLEGD